MATLLERMNASKGAMTSQPTGGMTTQPSVSQPSVPQQPQSSSSLSERLGQAGYEKTPETDAISRVNNELYNQPKKSKLLSVLEAPGEVLGWITMKALPTVAKEIAKPLTRTAGTIAEGLGVVNGEQTMTEQERLAMSDRSGENTLKEKALGLAEEMFQPYGTKRESIGGTAKIAATLLPGTKEALALVGVSTAPGWVTGMTMSGPSGLTYGAGEGLEKSGRDDADILSTIENTSVDSTISGTMSLIAGGAMGAAYDIWNGKPVIGQPSKERLEKLRLENQSKTEELAGRVLQPKERDRLNQMAEGLKIIKKDGVKTYGDLASSADDTIARLSSAQDSRFAVDQMKRSTNVIDDSDFLLDSLDDMYKVYSSTRDNQNATRILNIKRDLQTKGITPGEVNNIAREYNTVFRSKAFKSDGTPSTSWSGEGYENTRTAVKNIAREMMPDDVTKVLDDAIYKTYLVKEHADKMANAVMKLENKSIPEGTLGKIGKILGKGTKWTTRKLGVYDLVNEIAPGIFRGSSTMNPAQLESELAKNLIKINSLNGLKEKALEDALIELAEEAATYQAEMMRHMIMIPEAPALGTAKNPILAPSKTTTPTPIEPGQLGLAPNLTPSGTTQMSFEQAQSVMPKPLTESRMLPQGNTIVTPPPTPPVQTPYQAQPPSVASQVTAIKNTIGKVPMSGNFRITEETAFAFGKDGGVWMKQPGAMPTKLSPMEVLEMIRAGIINMNK